MARSRKLSPERKEFINSIIEHYHPEDAQDIQEIKKKCAQNVGCE